MSRPAEMKGGTLSSCLITAVRTSQKIKYCYKNFGLFSNHKKDIQLYIKLLDRFNARKISIRSCVLHIDNFFQHFCALFTRGKYNVKQGKN